jgi:F0F1-type ATP synthase assembly protein I
MLRSAAWSPTAAGLRAAGTIRRVLRGQLYAGFALMVVGGCWAGIHGAISALLGVFINITAGWVYAMLISRGRSRTAVDTLRTLVRAEAAKIALIVLQLWLVFAHYREMAPLVFIASFVVAVLMYPLVLLVREQSDMA